MAIRPTQSVAVGTSAVALTGTSQISEGIPGSSALLKNTGSATVYLGGDNTVTSANGFPWATGDGPLSFDLASGEVIWGICAAATSSTVAVLETAV